MTLSEIKQQLPISLVLNHYGLKATKHGMLACPFHNDKTPSLQIYFDTNTAYCFSSNCKTHGSSMDVIDFIPDLRSGFRFAQHALRRHQQAQSHPQSKGFGIGSRKYSRFTGIFNKDFTAFNTQKPSTFHSTLKISKLYETRNPSRTDQAQLALLSKLFGA